MQPESKMPFLQSFLRKGVLLGYVGLDKNLKGLKDPQGAARRCITPGVMRSIARVPR